ncbi:uncharacterized protein PHACADRAFT_23621 [Phanerochaete carnosa HHB-10118-sp]|uniref:HNH nuclease domain-containing protein n=1 Tax=Phanerochaete carnosa (strain HHB-10118-sp) TaxID=650164 RepID=K5WLV5_PHACS|nr:uncharacterized protein PHACADRAFT_23621 [Phanerochaete carnosa HHB-10118-sp]EKM60169.1 hypothetical protein PHACADRAFT_23621 [Phanerochaete carnosa HHB-10118-sp]
MEDFPTVNVLHPALDRDVTGALISLTAYDTVPEPGVTIQNTSPKPVIPLGVCPTRLEFFDTAITTIFSTDNTTWEVITSFDAWSFTGAPSRWKEALNTPVSAPGPQLSLYNPSGMAQETKRRDGFCLVTRQHEGTQNSHIVPAAQAKWYLKNRMWAHTKHDEQLRQRLGKRLINSSGNGLTLRADIHNEFDALHFVFLINDGALPKLSQQYHNVAVKIPHQIPAELLYARFALVIISQLPSQDLTKSPASSSHAGRRVVNVTRTETSSRTSASKPPSSDLPGIPEHHKSDEPMEVAEEEPESMQVFDRLTSAELTDVFHERFPHLREEVSHSTDCDWQTLEFHPETLKMEQLRDEWLANHPDIRATFEPVDETVSEEAGDREFVEGVKMGEKELLSHLKTKAIMVLRNFCLPHPQQAPSTSVLSEGSNLHQPQHPHVHSCITYNLKPIIHNVYTILSQITGGLEAVGAVWRPELSADRSDERT